MRDGIDVDSDNKSISYLTSTYHGSGDSAESHSAPQTQGPPPAVVILTNDEYDKSDYGGSGSSSGGEEPSDCDASARQQPSRRLDDNRKAGSRRNALPPSFLFSSYRVDEDVHVPSVRKEAKTVSDRRRLNKVADKGIGLSTNIIPNLRTQAGLAMLSGRSSSDSDNEEEDQKKKREKSVKRQQVISTDAQRPQRTPTAVGAIDVDCEMGHRRYMEDALVALQDVTMIGKNTHDLTPTAFFAVYDGHGGVQASRFVQKYLHLRLVENMGVHGQKDMKTSLETIIRRIDQEFLLHSGIPKEGLPSWLESETVQDTHVVKKSVKIKKDASSRKGEYVGKMVKLQQQRNILYRKLKTIPTVDGDNISVEDLVRHPELFERLSPAVRKRWSKFLQRFKSAYPDFYNKVLIGEFDFKKLQHLKDANVDSDDRQTAQLWMDNVVFTSDDEANSMGEEKTGEEKIKTPVIYIASPEKDGSIDAGSSKSVPTELADDPMTKNAPTAGSTVCVCLVSNEAIWTAWLGDSEAVLFRTGGAIVPLVNPHQPLRPDEQMRIQQLGGTVTKQILPGGSIPGAKKKYIGRVQGQLSVSRAIGDGHLKRWVTGDAEVLKTDLDGTEEFLVMASDGLWDVLTFKEVYKLVLRFITTERKKASAIKAQLSNIDNNLMRSLSKTIETDAVSAYGTSPVVKQRPANQNERISGIKGCARYLIRTALSCGSTDNVSVIVIFFKNGLRLSKALSENAASTGTGTCNQSVIDQEPLGSRRGLFSGVGLFNRARIRRVFARDRTGGTEDGGTELVDK